MIGERRRVLLAQLLLEAGTPVSTDRLIGALWSGTPPRLAKQALHNQVKRLRDALGEPAGRRLATGADGYLFEATEDELDILRFAALESAGRAAADAGDWAAAAGAFADALALYRAQPLADVPERPVFVDAAEYWRARRFQATRRHLDALRRLGRHDELPDPLTELIREHPLDEGLRGQLMLALFLGNRQAEALAVYEQTRRLLVDELGIEPGPQLRRLHSRILRSDQTLAPPRESAGPRPSGGADAVGPNVPRQLPATIRHFVGRAEHLHALSAAAEATDGHEGAATVLSVEGTAGVGKTALAVHWAHRVADRFPDGQLYADLRGFYPGAPPAAPAEALHRFLTALGVPPQRIPAALEDQAALYRSAAAGRRLLILLDNAHDAEQVRPLLPASAGCVALVTSRVRLVGLVASAGAVPLALDRLSATESADLLARRLGPERAGDRAALASVADLCARLPLALNILAARALTEPTRPLAEYTAELTEEGARGRLDALNAGDAATDVRTVFSWSYARLDEAAARLFRLLAAHPGPDLSTRAAASLAGLEAGTARGLLDRLVGAHLLTRLPGPRFAFHDLLRTYAVELAEADPEQTRAATERAQDHYLHAAIRAALLVSPLRIPLSDDGSPTPSAPEEIPGEAEARAWFDAEHTVLAGLIGQAGRLGLDRHAWRLAWCVAEHWDRRGRYAEIADTQRIALAATERLGDRTAQALARGALGRALVQSGELEAGHEQLNLSLAVQQEDGDESGQALTHQALAHMYARRAEHVEVLRHGEHSLRLFRGAGNDLGVGVALNVVGWAHSQLGAYHLALDYCREGVELARELGHRLGEAATLDSLGEVEHHLGDYAAAAAHFRESVDLRLELSQPQAAAASLTRLGETLLAGGDPVSARRAWAEALALLDGIEHSDAADLRVRLRALRDG
ncbi:AfsR/SARP family transcriptional regulator [Actinospica robiniae]|uniref:AfsR/SARP family transcriptional regulator n=1 Tax=Actinospica robiniae TaxID=304901 RepID=UPI0006888F80|nr:AfsR/SARP family transcriptional regulator [Actinospica robiniae]